jgi:hypothetical protein
MTSSRSLGAPLGGGLVLFVLLIMGASNVAAQTWLPVTSGLQLWLRSDMGLTVDASGHVQTWADQSGTGNDFTQAIPESRPTLTAGVGPGGTDVLHFDGTDDELFSPGQIVGGTSVTIFTVAAVREPGYPWVLGDSYTCDNRDGFQRRLFYEGHPGGGVDSPDFFDVCHDCWNDARASFPGINDTQFKVLTITGSGRIHNVRVFVGGVAAVMTPQTENTELTFSPGNALGFVHSAPNPFTEVDFAEFIVYDRELNQTERESVEAYLVRRYFTPVLDVDVAIKPGSFPSSINPKSKGVIPVAVLTTDIFDVNTVDSTTVRFGATGTEAALVRAALEDVDGDGDIDMILHFNTQATGIACGSTSAFLTGQTLSGQAIQGSGSIVTVGCK